MYFLLGKCARLFLLLILEAHWGAMVISLVLVKGQFFHVNGQYLKTLKLVLTIALELI